MKTLIYIIGVMLLLTACGQQQRAKSVVKDFMETYQQGDVDYLEFSDVDSTKVLSDSLINALQQQAGKKVSFQKRNSTTLLLIRAKYLLDSLNHGCGSLQAELNNTEHGLCSVLFFLFFLLSLQCFDISCRIYRQKDIKR